MPKKNVCAYRGCANTPAMKNMSFHRFPRDNETRLEWIRRSGNTRLSQLTEMQMSNQRLCCRHFLPKDIQTYGLNGRFKIKTGALPIEFSDNTEDPSGPVVEFASTGSPSFQPNVVYTVEIEAPDPEVGRLRRLAAALRRELKTKNQRIKRLEVHQRNNAKAVQDARSIDSLNDNQKDFLNMQLRHRKQLPWLQNEKQFALSLYHQSAKTYRFLRNEKKFALPSETLIRSWINDPQLTTTLSKKLVAQLQLECEALSTDENQVVIMWEEEEEEEEKAS